jgi:hypothetical protein
MAESPLPFGRGLVVSPLALSGLAQEPLYGRENLGPYDAMRRLWVSGSTEYPFPALADRPRRDSIRVLEDRDGDGGADKFTVLADRLSIPVGRDWELISPS